MASSAYANVRAAIADEGSDARVEVNQRALIDKILARYASAGAVYRELIQNSNDAEATTAEIIITTSSATSSQDGTTDSSTSTSSSSSKEVVTQVIYRNNGLPFRPQDWARLRKIAEGNPDETKVGAFGVGAYTMFSICEEPLVVSGKKGHEEAMAFFWKGDGLWTKTGKAPEGIVNMSASLGGKGDDSSNNWTSFMLPSRDPYPVPDLVEFGKFLTASLTFTQCLKTVRVYVNQILQLNIEKNTLESHTIHTPKSSSWWKNDGAATASSTGMFSLGKGSDLIQTTVEMNISLRKSLNAPDSDMETSTVKARYASAMVKTAIPANIEKRMVRVTKKKPPKELTVQIFLDAANDDDDTNEDGSGNSSKKLSSKLKMLKLTNKQHQSRAALIANSFAPTPGSGRIFIGFRTSQTTGLGIHLAAPLLPTVEREAIDFVDAALREYNSELLEISGMLMRLALEHEMGRIGISWEKGEVARDRWEAEREERKKMDEQTEQAEETEAASRDAASAANESTSISSSLFSFAKFMAKGVTNTVTEAIKAVPEIIVGDDDETTELLNPLDNRPLSIEERDAILLMKAYCPRPSTPDSLVGQCLAKGFSRCLSSSSPPVLTMGGVVRGSDAKLPSHGMEAFGFSNVVRRIMLENAREYHTLIANVPPLTMNDLISSLKNQVLEEKMLIRLLKWYPKVCRIERSYERRGLSLKDAVRFKSNTEDPESSSNKTATSSSTEADELKLAQILYYTPKKLVDLPFPETCFYPGLQKEIGLRILENSVYRNWFESLPFDIWTSFISQHCCLSEGRPGEVNILVLTTLSKHYDSLEGSMAKRRFIELLPTNSPCIPYDSDVTPDGKPESNLQTASPKELYLASSDLTAFKGVGVFHKVAQRVSKSGVSDAFLLAMGVRTTISIDFLFLHLDTLSWNTNPKPLIKYLLEADLSNSDLVKLRSTQYLPAEDDQAHVYAPSELYLKNEDINIFPFVRFLQWPASEGMSKAHNDFLIKLGLRVSPPLDSVMSFMTKESEKDDAERDETVYAKALNYLTQHLGPGGLYERDFSRYRSSKILPCLRQNLESGEVLKEMQSPSACYWNPSALTMGFSTLDPQLDTEHIATRTKCNKDPSCPVLVKRLVQLVEISTAKTDFLERNGGSDEDRLKLTEKLLTLFDAVFLYLATRTSDFQTRDLAPLAKKAFIPHKYRGLVSFYQASQIFFESSSPDKDASSERGSLTGTLFQQIKYNAFLSLAGVKNEPTLQEIFDLMLEKPDEVLDSLGEEKYKMLLRRLASDPPFKQITKQIRSTPFLLGYLVIDEEVSEDDGDKEGGQKAQYVLARAEDIFIVDNSFLRRQFPMLCSPMEQSLEEFYYKVGSKYVSQVVKKEFEVKGQTSQNTALTRSLAKRIHERKPLLLSPTNSSRPLISNASKILDDQFLEFVEAEMIQAKYTFERSSKHLKVTCCSKQKTRQKTTVCITKDPDWFDIGTAIGALILERCQLEDALLFSQLLESPLETLRYRGFPVDRIMRPAPPPPPLPPKPAPAPTPPPPQQTTPTAHQEANRNAANCQGHNDETKGNDGFSTILQQMYPACPPDVIRGLLGPNPSKEKAKQVADLLASEMPPADNDKDTKNGTNHDLDTDANTLASNASTEDESMYSADSKKNKKKKSFMNKMLKPFHPKSGSSDGLGSDLVNQSGNKGLGSDLGRQVVNETRTHPAPENSKTPVTPEQDASSQQSLEAMLNNAVQSSRSVDNAGVRAPETVVNNLPQGLEREDGGCDVNAAQNIQPFKGPHGNFKSRNGIKVYAGVDAAAHAFLSQNFNLVERFSAVIHNLAQVYKLHPSTVAIFYDTKGNTIAFNYNRALYFNLRYFTSLHQHNVDSSCYSYWYMTYAHELAHNLVSAHNKEHGSFTESIAAMYLPDFIRLLSGASSR